MRNKLLIVGVIATLLIAGLYGFCNASQDSRFGVLNPHVQDRSIQEPFIQNLPIQNPSIVDIVQRIDENEIYSTVYSLQNFTTRCYGYPGNVEASTYLFNKLSNITGLTVEYQGGEFRNVIATLPGRDLASSVIYMVGAHYDSINDVNRSDAPGATDNGGGVAIVLELARIMSHCISNHTIVFALWNAEESSSDVAGSSVYVENAVASQLNISLYINFDSSCYDPYDRFTLDIMSNNQSQWVSDLMTQCNSLYNIGFNLTHNVHECGSDHKTFWGHGYTAVMTHSETHGPAHSANDTIDKVSTLYAKKNGQLGMSVLAILAETYEANFRPSAPQNLEVMPGKENVTLTWDAPAYSNASAVSGYMISFGISPDSLIDQIIWDHPICVLSGLTKGTQYYFSVAAQNDAGWGLNSSTVSGTPFSVPSVPLGFEVIAGLGNVTLSWTEPSYIGPGTIMYHLFRNSSLIWSGLENSYIDTNVVNGFGYVYDIAANNSVGWGGNSSPLLATLTGPPSEPIGLLMNEGDARVSLSWTAPASDGGFTVIGFKIYRGTEPSSMTLLNTTIATVYSDLNLTNGQIYYYKICAYNSAGNSMMSDIHSATPSSGGGADNTILFVGIGALAVIASAGVASVALKKRR